MTRSQSKIGTLLTAALVLIFSIPNAGAVELTIWHHTYPPAEEFIKQKAAEYTKQNPNVTFKFESDPHGDYEVKLFAAFAGGNAPDIINLLDYLYPKFVQKKLLAEISLPAFGVKTKEELEALYEPGALVGNTVDGKIYGVPEELNTFALFLNKKHFAEAGLDATDPKIWPKTWKDLFALAKKVERRDASGKLTRLGFNWVWGNDGFWYAMQYWPILVQYGGHPVDETGAVKINSPECVKAFTETWLSVIKDGIGGPNYASVNPVNALQDFGSGRQSMAMAGIWAPPLWDQEVRDNYVTVPLPQLDPAKPATLLYNYSMTVTSASKHPEEAWKFLRFLTSDGDGYLTHTGYITGLRGWNETPTARKVQGVDVFAQGMKWGSYYWKSVTWAQEGAAIKKAIESFAQGTDVKEALDGAAEEMKAARSQ